MREKAGGQGCTATCVPRLRASVDDVPPLLTCATSKVSMARSRAATRLMSVPVPRFLLGSCSAGDSCFRSLTSSSGNFCSSARTLAANDVERSKGGVKLGFRLSMGCCCRCTDVQAHTKGRVTSQQKQSPLSKHAQLTQDGDLEGRPQYAVVLPIQERLGQGALPIDLWWRR